MRPFVVVGLVVAAFSGLAASLAAQDHGEIRITLDQAMALAFERSPALEARRAELKTVRADLTTARIFPFNPELGVFIADRDGLDESSTDRGIGLAQELEVAGQRGKRIRVATSALEAAEQSFERQRRILAAEVELSFADALRDHELLRIALVDAGLTRDLLAYEEGRLEAGAATQIELNLARVAAGRSERAAQLARSREIEARSLLAAIIGLDPGVPPDPVGELSPGLAELPPLGDLLSEALQHRTDLAAVRQELEAARAGVSLAKALAVPNLRLSAFFEQEEGTDDIGGLAFSIPLPFFNRNQGGIARAEAVSQRLDSEVSVTELEVKQQVASVYAQYQAARASAATLQELVVGTLEESLQLLREALGAGKVSATEMLVVRRELVGGEIELIEALADAWIARVMLNLAAGKTLAPDLSEESQP